LGGALGSRVKVSRTVPQGSHFALLERSAPVLYRECEEFLRKH
jgi:hypothetical protein